MGSVGGQDHHLYLGVAHRLLEGSVDLIGHLMILRVARFWPGQHDPSHVRVGQLVTDLLERLVRRPVHSVPPFPRLNCSPDVYVTLDKFTSASTSHFSMSSQVAFNQAGLANSHSSVNVAPSRSSIHHR